jgi:hypothetical protein
MHRETCGLRQGSATLVPTTSPSSITMVKDKTLQESGEPFPNDQRRGFRATVKGLISKRKTAPERVPHVTGPALPAASSANQDNPLEAEPIPALVSGRQQEPQGNTIPDGAPVSKDDLRSHSSREERGNAEFCKVRDELNKVIQSSNGTSPIQLFFLDSSCNEVGNLSQMAWDIDLAISEFMKEREKQKESQKGKATAKSWVHKFSFAGQRILSTASSATSVG